MATPLYTLLDEVEARAKRGSLDHDHRTDVPRLVAALRLAIIQIDVYADALNDDNLNATQSVCLDKIAAILRGEEKS